MTKEAWRDCPAAPAHPKVPSVAVHSQYWVPVARVLLHDGYHSSVLNRIRKEEALCKAEQGGHKNHTAALPAGQGHCSLCRRASQPLWAVV